MYSDGHYQFSGSVPPVKLQMFSELQNKSIDMTESQAMSSLVIPSPLQKITPDWRGIEKLKLYVKRDDDIHPVVSGNKYRKLKSTLTQLAFQPQPVVSFGGGFSNHIHALAYCCQALNCPFTAIIRGHYPSLTPMLNDIKRWGADIQFVDKKTYQQRHNNYYLAELQTAYPGALIIPEGGSQQSALDGIRDMMDEINVDFDIVAAPVASGATMAGIVSSLSQQQRAIGIGVLKGQDYLTELVSQFLGVQPTAPWTVDGRFHHGGYAKKTPELSAFCDQFHTQTNIALEPVYSGKLFYALKFMVEHEEFTAGSTIVAVHTGGLQGSR